MPPLFDSARTITVDGVTALPDEATPTCSGTWEARST